MAMRFWRALTISAGAGFVAYLMHQLGASNIWRALRMIGWRFIVLMALEFMVHAFSARAWWHLFPGQRRRGCFPRLWVTYLAGNALNDITPGAPIGGDPFKAIALKEKFAMSVTAATLLSARLGQALARALFVILGMLTTSWSIKLESFPLKGLAIGFLLTAAGLGIFAILQLRGLSGPAISVFHHLWLPDSWAERIGQVLERIDVQLSELYRTRPIDFVVSVGLAFSGLCIGIVQIWLIMGWIGLPCSWLASLTIESFSILLSVVLFVVPGSLGVQEGGKLLVFTALGLPLSAGLSLGIIIRLMFLVNLAAGFAALVWLRPVERAAATQTGGRDARREDRVQEQRF
ncbi:MAG: flippase-like domain-containing protein [Deltaproteobacteria bacterium]|nr:flippase-like domain-containing protein [Deltaproteobacteria bacterium]